MIGRTAALLEGIDVAIVPSGWRVVDRAGADVRRARAWLRQDLDAFEEACAERTGTVKVQVVGPWTLAAGIELASGELLLRDHGARRDLVVVLAAAVEAHVRDVSGRMPRGTVVVVQIDEPLVDRVLHGQVATASGWATYRSLDVSEVRAGLSAVVRAAQAGGAGVVMHSCAAEPPLALMLEAGVDGVSFDLSLVSDSSLDLLASAVESDRVLMPGVIDPIQGQMSEVMDTVKRVHRWWSAMGFASQPVAHSITLTPTCGLAGASPQRAREVLAQLRGVAQVLEEDPDADYARR